MGQAGGKNRKQIAGGAQSGLGLGTSPVFLAAISVDTNL